MLRAYYDGAILTHTCFRQIGQGSSGLDGEWLFKAALVVMTTKLVQVSGLFQPRNDLIYLRERSAQAISTGTSNILPLITPLIKESMTSPAKEHFEEDGIEL